MNKRTIIASLNDIANELDNTGLFEEANSITKLMHKLAMSSKRDNMIIQDMSETMNNFKMYTNRLEQEMDLFKRVLRAMQDTLEDRRSDPEEIFRHKRKLQTVFEDIKKLSIKLNFDVQELSRLSQLSQSSSQNEQQEQSANTSSEKAQTVPSDEPVENMNENSETNMPSQRRPFSN